MNEEFINKYLANNNSKYIYNIDESNNLSPSNDCISEDKANYMHALNQMAGTGGPADCILLEVSGTGDQSRISQEISKKKSSSPTKRSQTPNMNNGGALAQDLEPLYEQESYLEQTTN